MTSMNTTGVPCTIKWFEGKSIKPFEFESSRVQIDKEFQKKMSDITSTTNEYYTKIQKILDKPHIGKKDRTEILQQIEMLQCQIQNNLPYMKKVWTRQMDKTVLEAKREFETFVDTQLKNVGLPELKKRFKLLEEKKGDSK